MDKQHLEAILKLVDPHNNFNTLRKLSNTMVAQVCDSNYIVYYQIDNDQSWYQSDLCNTLLETFESIPQGPNKPQNLTNIEDSNWIKAYLALYNLGVLK